jgi:hypothetical protein
MGIQTKTTWPPSAASSETSLIAYAEKYQLSLRFYDCRGRFLAPFIDFIDSHTQELARVWSGQADGFHFVGVGPKRVFVLGPRVRDNEEARIANYHQRLLLPILFQKLNVARYWFWGMGGPDDTDMMVAGGVEKSHPPGIGGMKVSVIGGMKIVRDAIGNERLSDWFSFGSDIRYQMYDSCWCMNLFGPAPSTNDNAPVGTTSLHL